MSSGHDPRRWPAGYRARWLGLSLLSKILLMLSLLASLAIVVIILFFVYLVIVYLVIGAYAGPSDPISVNGVLFPVALLFLLIVGLPSMLVCVLLWAGYAVSKRRDTRIHARRGEPQ